MHVIQWLSSREHKTYGKHVCTKANQLIVCMCDICHASNVQETRVFSNLISKQIPFLLTRLPLIALQFTIIPSSLPITPCGIDMATGGSAIIFFGDPPPENPKTLT